MWKNTVEPGRPSMTIRFTRIACWVPKATNTHTQVVYYSLLFNSNNGCTSAPQCSSYTYTACPVLLIFRFPVGTRELNGWSMK